jgi:AbrB family looped-hinge helix DNA binding protein
MQESTVTSNCQTTLPRDVRAALGLRPGDRVRYLIIDGEVRLLKVPVGRRARRSIGPGRPP